MALNTPNYGYPTANFSAAFSSTPSSDLRSQRPRFAYSGLSMYPRPRSSASKPNPDIGFHESNVDSFGSQMSSLEKDYLFKDMRLYNNSYDSYSSQKSNFFNNSFNDSYYDYPQKLPSYYNSSYDELMSSEKSNYFSCNESLYMSNNQSSFDRQSEITDNYSMMVNTSHSFYGNNNDKFFNNYLENYKERFHPYSEGGNSNYIIDYSTNDSEYFYQNKSSGNFKGNFQPNNGNGNFKGNFQTKNNMGNFQSNSASRNFKGAIRKFKAKQKKTSFDQKFLKGKSGMEQKSALRCDLCNLNFTSIIPMEMHMQGKNHIKKMKSQLALQAIVGTAKRKEIHIGNVFRCELCDITLNSSLQLQMHLDGNKHRNKFQQQQRKEKKEESSTEGEANKDEFGIINGKGVIRPLPSDFEELQPAKLSKFSCDLCNMILNSTLQLQQHLDSKRHKAKLEGKPYKVFRRRNKKISPNTQKTDETKVNNGTEVEQEQQAQGEEQADKQEQALNQEMPSEQEHEDEPEQDITSEQEEATEEEQEEATEEQEKAPEQEQEETPEQEQEETPEQEQEETPEQEQEKKPEQEQNKQQKRKPQTVLGIKTLQSTFVQGETLN